MDERLTRFNGEELLSPSDERERKSNNGYLLEVERAIRDSRTENERRRKVKEINDRYSRSR